MSLQSASNTPDMQVSQQALNKFKSKGFKARPYRDETGALFIGYNHRIVPKDGVAEHDIINSFKAHQLLETDVKQMVNTINKFVYITDQEEFDALVLSAFEP